MLNMIETSKHIMNMHGRTLILTNTTIIDMCIVYFGLNRVFTLLSVKARNTDVNSIHKHHIRHSIALDIFLYISFCS